MPIMNDYLKAILETKKNFIAEIKRKSRSKGQLAKINYPPDWQTNIFRETLQLFQFSLTNMYSTDSNSSERFYLDPVQIKEAIAVGASAVLLIVVVLKENTKDLLQVVHDLGIDAIVEIHNRNELNQAVEMGADIIGVNNPI